MKAESPLVNTISIIQVTQNYKSKKKSLPTPLHELCLLSPWYLRLEMEKTRCSCQVAS
jgi:hypothetical protein